jgi:inhibitor of cysteine peptidase
VNGVVQKEVRKKTRIYGAVAVLSAIVLVTLIYGFGSSPAKFPPTETPSVSAMQTFSSYDQLRQFIAENSQGSSNYRGGPLDEKFFGEPTPVPAPMSVDSGSAEIAQSDSYSTTNIQVAGVDEADIVKTDGTYIYTISSATSGVYYTSYYGTATDTAVYIIKADPNAPEVVSKISLANDTVPAGLFLSQDGNRLVVLASRYQTYDYASSREKDVMLMPYQSDVYTFIDVYDVSDKAEPVLARNFTISGSYFNSRMVGDYVYAVISQPANLVNGAVALPKVYEETHESDVSASRVYYTDVVETTYFTFTTFIGLNILDDAQQPTNMTIMMGGTSTMYVSTDNMYATYPTWSDGQYTSIYRVHIDGNSLVFKAKGSVPGYVLNQYSMDEYSGNFRIATTWQKNTQMNNVYVLNMNLSLVGKLENLAEGERIYSARFMGDKAYLVTFRQMDPFFVLDMSNPAEPKVAGELKIPGYSSYLHPFDENHVIGLGMENNTVKLSLFDVTNVNAPKEIAKYTVQGDYSYSDALYEPKAFLFDKQKELLVIPVSITQYGVVSGGGVVPPSGEEGDVISAPDMQASYWQGAYVFKLTLKGFELEGGITHQNTSQQYYYGDYNLNVNRALYIGNTLYTVSNDKVQLNSLDTLAFIAEVNLR